MKYARKKGWPEQSIKEIEQAMTQKVEELKRQAVKMQLFEKKVFYTIDYPIFSLHFQYFSYV